MQSNEKWPLKAEFMDLVCFITIIPIWYFISFKQIEIFRLAKTIIIISAADFEEFVREILFS